MKTISRRICGFVLGLGVLGLIVPVVRADEMADWMAEQRRQNDEYQRQWQQWREEQQRERDAQDKYYAERDAQAKADREWQQTQDERAAWYKWNEQKQREQQEWDAWMARMGQWSTGAPDSTPGRVRVARRAGVVILNPFALEKMAPAEQEKVRQQATQSGHQILTEQQIVQNPFVRAAK
jgi:hypothetical protein